MRVDVVWLWIALGLLFSSCLVSELPAQSEHKEIFAAPMAENGLLDGSDFRRRPSQLETIFPGWNGADGRSREVLASADELSWRLRRTTYRKWHLSGFGGARLVIWDEDHFDSRDRGWGTESSFEQSRTFAGLNWQIHPKNHSRFEFGYLNQTWDEPGRDDRRFHFLSLNFYF